VIRHFGQRLAELVGEGLPIVRVGRHLVGLIHDDEIPPGAQEAVSRIVDAGDPRDGRDDLRALLPRVLPVVGPEDAAAHHLERFAELVLQLPLPLEGQVGGGDDQGAFHQATGLHLLQEEPGHDGLPGARVVREEEPDARQFQEVVVDRLQLVRERIDTGDGQGEERVVLVGQAQALRFHAEAERAGIAVEDGLSSGDDQVSLLLGREHDVMGLTGA